MDVERIIKKIIEKHKGFITRSDIDENKIPSIYLSRYVKKNNLVKVSRGFYAEKDWIIDPYVIFQYTYPRYIFSFISGIYLHGLGDLIPNYLEVTGPLNYRPMSKNRDDVICHTDTVFDTYNLGIIDVKTNLGNYVKCYDKEKTICDLIRNKDKIEIEVYLKAIKIYAKSKDKNINKLMEYAKIMKIENKVRNQMEVILDGN